MVKTINIKANGQELLPNQGCHEFTAGDGFEFVNPMNKPVTVTLTAVEVKVTVPGKGKSVPQKLKFNYTVAPGEPPTPTKLGCGSGQISGSIIIDP
ncbi:MAG: hypothetical protein MJK04_36265 [Psychrosphaera sp.]|nr:hypothetical protein [Psychrosphaera sp.]